MKMCKFKQFAVKHPIVFGFVLIIVYSTLSTLTWPISQVYPYPEGFEVSAAAAKIMIAACFALLLWRFGWIKTVGYTSPGRKQIWFIVIPLMIYKVIFGIYAFTGSFQISFPQLRLALAIIFFTFTTSLLEETMYRGLLLTSMMKSWGHTRRGIFTSAILSGLFWASLHFFNLLIRPFPVVFLQVLSMTMVGFFYAAIMLASKSIWPTIAVHWAVNSFISMQSVLIPNFEETAVQWTRYGGITLPLVLVGVYLLRQNLSNQNLYESEDILDEHHITHSKKYRLNLDH
jgi:membrane protease YdiL (CAAX protease family)